MLVLLGLHALAAVLAPGLVRSLGRRAFGVLALVPAASFVLIATRAPAALAGGASEERFRRAVGIGTVGVLFFGLDGRVTDANGAFERMSGQSRDELLALGDWELLTPPEFRGATARAASLSPSMPRPRWLTSKRMPGNPPASPRRRLAISMASERMRAQRNSFMRPLNVFMSFRSSSSMEA